MTRDIRRIFETGVVFLLITCPLWAVCTGNTLGACTDDKPQNCVITRAAVGTNLDATSNDNVAVGRTSFDRYPVEFTHDGATSSFTVSIVPPSPTDAGTSVTESTCEGKLTVFFTNSETKLVKVRVAQINLGGRIATSQNALEVIFDKVPPVVTPLQVFIGSDTTGQPQAYSSGTTFFTSGEITITARVTDPNPSAPLEELGMQVIDGLTEPGQVVGASSQTQGIFELPLGLAREEEDGEFLVRVVGLDSNSGVFPDGSPANQSEPVLYRVVLDRASPVLTKLEVIKNPGSESQVIEEVPGVFIPAGTVRIRATFSENLKTPPSLTVTQIGSGVGEPSEPYKIFFDPEIFNASPDTVEYILTPLSDLRDIGPISLTFEPDGFDAAGNPVSLDSGVLARGSTIERALILDTVPPDLNRVNPEIPGLIQSEPKNGEKIPRGEFPQQITIIVKDYNVPEEVSDESQVNTLGRENASGVDFSKILNNDSSAGEAGIRVELLDPDQNPILGTLATRPPNGLVYILRPESRLFESQGGQAPEGNYTVRVTVVDLVGNRSTETILFEVDTTDIAADRLQVSLAPEPDPGDDFQADSSNPLLKNPIRGSAIPDNPDLVDLSTLDSVRELLSAKICSTDSSFDLTRSLVSVKARLNGPDTIPRELLSTKTPDQGDSNTTCEGSGSITVAVDRNQRSVFPSFDFDFPNPNSVGVGVEPGERDPRFGLFDGPYLVEIQARDLAGNLSDPIEKEFLLDTTPPYTDSTFPKDSSKVNTPLRHVSSIVVDPHPPKLHVFDEDGKINFGAGISIDFSGMSLGLQVPYRPNELDPDVFNLVSENELIGRISFTHKPNSIDPTLPTFNPKDDTFRVLLEFINRQGTVVTLPTDGSADGIYRMDVTPVDNAGNSIDGARSGLSGFQNFSGAESDAPRELRKSFFFLMDTVPPHLSIDSPGGGQSPGNLKVSGNRILLTGEARDLSALPSTPDLGGAGIDKVEFELVLMVDGVMAPSIPGSEGQSAKPNPILTGRAFLEPIQNSSSDPHTSETRPLNPDTYPSIPLESRKFRIDTRLPALTRVLRPQDLETGGQGVYFLRVKATDLAGNISVQSIELTLNFSTLTPPVLMEPNLSESLGSTAVNFKWRKVENAQDYILEVSSPSGEVSTYAVAADTQNEISSLQILNQQGSYLWQVTARDSVGNLGIPSARQAFTIDTRAPVVELVNFSDLSPEATARITRGQFKVHILFNEELSSAPEVSFQPFVSSIPRQFLTTTRFGGDVWEGIGQIPQEADENWDGIAILWIESARDRSGIKMLTNKSHNFEIETGPDYELRFFENPVTSEEIVVLIRASELLAAPPVLFSPTGVEVMNEHLQQVGERSFSTVFRLASFSTDTGSIEITGRDLAGNASTRKVTFPIELIKGDSGGSLSNSKMRLDFPPGVFEGERSIALLPGSTLGSEEGNSRSSISRGSELKMIREIGLAVPENLSLARDAELKILSKIPPTDYQAYYIYSQGEWRFLGTSMPGGSGEGYSISSLGRIAILEDIRAPRIEVPDEEVSLADGPFRFRVEDYGSGVDPSSVQVFWKDQLQNTAMESQGEFRVEFSREISNGEEDFRIEASDRSGNHVIHHAVLSIAGPVRLKVEAFPNPARSFCTLRYTLNRSVDFLRIKVMDSFGKLVFLSDSDEDFTLSTNASTHEFEWMLEDQLGREVSNGIYFAQVYTRAADGSTDRVRLKIAVLR